jgi:DNA-binding response OmpR family regulator
MRILVVDDNTLNRFLLVHLLEEQGYVDCYEAENGREAISMAERLKPDLVLLDVVMPEMDGYEVAPILKQMAGDIYLPIIFITALDDEESLARCLEVGGDDFAAKPFDKVILAAKIRAHSRTRLLSKKAHEQNQQLTYYRNSVEREHKIVEHIFENALTVDEKLAGLIDYQLRPATDFNGDLFLMSASPCGGMYFLIGDFTGHGLASAIGALPVAQAFQTMAKKGLSLMEMAETINQTLLKLLPVDMFFAAAIVEISHTGEQIDVWNGGMPHLIMIDEDGRICRRFESRHMSLGILESDEFESEVVRYTASLGERLVGFSDGVVELSNEQNEMLGETGFEKLLKDEPLISVDQLMTKMIEYRGNRERDDDVTVVSYVCQSLKILERNQEISLLPFKVELDLGPEQIRASDPIQGLMQLLSSQIGIATIHSELFTVLSELFNNALDHGLLKLDSKLKQDDGGFFEYFQLRERKLREMDSGSIQVLVDYQPENRSLCIRLKDSGDGFIEVDNKSSADDSFGRGIPLIKELCKSVKFIGNGNTVDVVLKI